MLQFIRRVLRTARPLRVVFWLSKFGLIQLTKSSLRICNKRRERNGSRHAFGRNGVSSAETCTYCHGRALAAAQAINHFAEMMPRPKRKSFLAEKAETMAATKTVGRVRSISSECEHVCVCAVQLSLLLVPRWRLELTSSARPARNQGAVRPTQIFITNYARCRAPSLRFLLFSLQYQLSAVPLARDASATGFWAKRSERCGAIYRKSDRQKAI